MSTETSLPVIFETITSANRSVVVAHLQKLWGSEIIVSREKIYHVNDVEGFIARYEDNVAGIITYVVDKNQCEILTLDALLPRQGVGSKLLGKVKDLAQQHGHSRLWLITSNDNIEAIQFYQKRGMRMIAIHKDAITAARKIKPQIPPVAENGIPIQDEVEFELLLS